MAIQLGTVGKLYGRYVLPEGIPNRELCLFSIVDLEQATKRAASDVDWRAQEFGISWTENSSRLNQIFGYYVATIGQMEQIAKMRGVEKGGYYYICYKKPVNSDVKHLFPPSNTGVELLGWHHHSSHFVPCAEEEAMIVTYYIAKQYGLDISRRIAKELEILIPERDVKWSIENEAKTYGLLEKKVTLKDLAEIKDILHLICTTS